MGKKQHCLFALGCLLDAGSWSSLSGGRHVSGICGSGMGTRPLTWGCQSSLHLSGLGGLGEEDAGEEMPQGRSCLCAFCRALVLRPASWR